MTNRTKTLSLPLKCQHYHRQSNKQNRTRLIISISPKSVKFSSPKIFTIPQQQQKTAKYYLFPALCSSDYMYGRGIVSYFSL